MILFNITFYQIFMEIGEKVKVQYQNASRRTQNDYVHRILRLTFTSNSLQKMQGVHAQVCVCCFFPFQLWITKEFSFDSLYTTIYRAIMKDELQCTVSIHTM